MSVWLYGGPENRAETHYARYTISADTNGCRIAVHADESRKSYGARKHAHVICNFVLRCDCSSKEVCLAPDGVQRAT